MLTSTPPGNADDVYDWISQFIGREQRANRRSAGLDNMKLLSALAGYPEKCAPAIHVAGSKGKGSVTGMTAAILTAAGIKTALYASPHVSDFRERISLGGVFFDEETYARSGGELMAYTDAMIAKEDGEPHFFELFTLWFFLCAQRAGCGAMAVETGMGGRLDATNILDPLVSVITLIELEHTGVLGDTIAAIAGEKAGIIKAERPLILAEQAPDALKVFRERAAERGSPLLYFPDCAEVRDLRVDKKGSSFTLELAQGGSRRPEILGDLFIPIPGGIQAKNAALAVLAVKTAFPKVRNESVYAGLASFSLPARFERMAGETPFVIDGAHTRESVAACAKTFSSLYGKDGILIFGCAAGKDVPSMAEICVPCFSTIIITTPGTFKKSFPEEIYEAFVRNAAQEGNGKESRTPPEILFIPDTQEAIDRALKEASRKGRAVLGTGSFYLAGEIRDRLKPKNRN